MYLSLKTILLGAAVASAIPFPPNGTHNTTGPEKTKAHPSIFGLPWWNSDRPNSPPKNYTDCLDILKRIDGGNGTVNVTHSVAVGHPNPPPVNVTDYKDLFDKFFDCVGINGTHNTTRYHSPRIGVTGIRKDGGRVGRSIPPPKSIDSLRDWLREHLLGGSNRRRSLPRRDLADVLGAIRDIVEAATGGDDGAADVERRDSAEAPDALHARGDEPFCMLKCWIRLDLKCPNCRGPTR